MTNEEYADLKKEMKLAIAAAKRKEDPFAAYEKFCNLFRSADLDSSLYRDFGWLIYYLLRAKPHNMVLQRKRLLLQYLKLNLERPSLLHSLILFEAVVMKKNSPSGFRLKDFVAMWGLENLRPEDWVKKKLENGRLSNSLVENLIGTYVKEVINDNTQASDEFISLLDKAMATYRSNSHLPLYKARALVSAARNDEALSQYKTMLRRWPKKFFLWSETEELLPRSDLDLRIAFLCKTISYVRDESFLGDIRLRLADLQIRKGLYTNALYELMKYERYYMSQNWRLKDCHETLLNRAIHSAPYAPSIPTPYTRAIPTPYAPSIPTPYADYLPLADRFLSLP